MSSFHVPPALAAQLVVNEHTRSEMIDQLGTGAHWRFEQHDEAERYQEMVDMLMVKGPKGYYTQGEFLIMHIRKTAPPFVYNILDAAGFEDIAELINDNLPIAGAAAAKIVNLNTRPELNEKTGYILGMCLDSNNKFRYAINLEGVPENVNLFGAPVRCTVLIKPSNLMRWP